MVEAVLHWMGVRRMPAGRQSVADLLRNREALAEEQAEAALNGMRAVRLEYDPRCRNGRQARLDALHAKIIVQQARIHSLRNGFDGDKA